MKQITAAFDPRKIAAGDYRTVASAPAYPVLMAMTVAGSAKHLGTVERKYAN